MSEVPRPNPSPGTPANPLPVTATRVDPLAPIVMEEDATPLELKHDKRRRLEQPLPVHLISVADVTLLALPEHEPALDALYVSLLLFEKEQAGTESAGPVYRAENFNLRFAHAPGPVIEHATLKPLGIIIPSLGDTERQLVERELEYTRQRGLVPGREELLLQDPAGNWLSLVERREMI